MTELSENQMIESLKKEINSLSNDLIKSQKFIVLLEKFRYCLIEFNNNCDCDRNIKYKNTIKLLENEYNIICDKSLTQLAEKSREKSVSLTDRSKSMTGKFNENKVLINKLVKKLKKKNDTKTVYNFSDNKRQNIEKYYEKIKSNDILLKRIIKQDVETVIDESNALIKVFRSPEQTKGHNKPVFGYGCNWFDCQFISSIKYRVIEHIQLNHNTEDLNTERQLTKQYNDCENFAQNNEFTDNSNESVVMEDMKDFLICMACGQHFDDRKSYERHAKTEKNTIDSGLKKGYHKDDDKDYYCTVCHEKYENYGSLKSHYYRDHIQYKRCQWPGCDFECKTNVQLRGHVFRHFKTGFQSRIKLTKCSVAGCEREFTQKKLLLSHIQADHPEVSTKEVFTCQWPGCEFTTNQKDNLGRHIKRHGNKTVKCVWPGCESVFFANKELKIHMVSHSDSRDYACDWPECGAKFKLRKALTNHYVTHTGVKKFVCSVSGCDKRFATKFKLNKHTETHNEKKTFVCSYPYCGKAFAGSLALYNHNRKIHSLSKTIICDWDHCLKRFETNEQLERHKKAKHLAVRKFPCLYPGCGLAFADGSTLKKHTNRHYLREKKNK